MENQKINFDIVPFAVQHGYGVIEEVSTGVRTWSADDAYLFQPEKRRNRRRIKDVIEEVTTLKLDVMSHRVMSYLLIDPLDMISSDWHQPFRKIFFLGTTFEQQKEFNLYRPGSRYYQPRRDAIGAHYVCYMMCCDPQGDDWDDHLSWIEYPWEDDSCVACWR